MPRSEPRKSETVIPRTARKAPEKAGEPLASLLEPAPLLLRCMACLSLRVASPVGVVLWHPDAVDPKHDCAGGGAPGIPVCAHCWGPLTLSTGTLPDGSRVCRTGTPPGAEGPPDCYGLVTAHGEKLGARRAA